MKTCPTCHRNYEDNTLKFCLDDGSLLAAETASRMTSIADLTLVLPGHSTEQPPTIASPSPPTTASQRSTITSQGFAPAASAARRDAGVPSSRSGSRSNALLVVAALIIGGSAIVVALIATRGRQQDAGSVITPAPATPSSSETPTNRGSAYSSSPSRSPNSSSSPASYSSPSARPGERPTPTPKPSGTPENRTKPMFEVMNNISFNGSRITYYPRPSVGLCQADCAANANCKGFTWIRPDAYNAGDSAMCYLMSAVTAKTSHPCCISAVKN